MSELVSGGTAPQFTVEPCPLCKAPIIWAHDAALKPIALNAEAAIGGVYSLRPGRADVPLATKPTASRAFGVKLRTLHTTTCPKGKMLNTRGRSK